MVLGDKDCFALGETYPRIGPVPDIVDGFDLRCPRPAIVPPISDGPVVDISDCHFQQWAAKLTESVYANDEALTGIIALERYPLASVRYWGPLASFLPGSVILVIGSTTIVAMSGTQQSLQWLGQVLSGLIPMANYANYSTYEFWQVSATGISARYDSCNPNPNGQVVFIGHSYGGAVATLLAANFRLAIPTRRVSCLTFGCPKVGDSRLNVVMRKTECIHLVAEDDIVPYMPPSGTTGALLLWLLSQGLLRVFQDFAWLENSYRLNEDGTRDEIADESSPYAIVVEYMLVWLFGGPDLVVAWQHQMENYRRLIVCDGVHPKPPDVEPACVVYDGSAEYPSAMLGSGGAMYDGSAIDPTPGGMLIDGSAAIPVVGNGGMLIDGSVMIPPVSNPPGGMLIDGGIWPPPALLLVSDDLHNATFVDITAHTIAPTNVVGASWSPAGEWNVDTTEAVPNQAASGVRVAGIEVTAFPNVRVTAKCYPLSGIFQFLGRECGVWARGVGDSNPGWIATVVDNGDGTGLLRLADLGGTSGFDETRTLDAFASGDIVELTCEESIITARCNGQQLSYGFDTSSLTLVWCGIISDAPLTGFPFSAAVAELNVYTNDI